MLPALSPELIDIIIDHLHDDKSSLNAWGLTSTQWLASSRYHLFSEISLSPSSVTNFLEFITSPGVEHITSIIQRLEVTNFNKYVGGEDAKYAHAVTLLGSCLVRVPNVTFIRICNGAGISSDILSKLSGVQELVLENLYLPAMDEALRMIHTFPHLRTLSIDRVQWLGDDITVTTPELKHLSIIRQVRLDRHESDGFTNWLMGLENVPAVKTLYCNAFDPDTRSGSREKWLNTLGPSIQSVELSYDRCSSPRNGKCPLNHIMLIRLNCCLSTRAYASH